MNTRYFIRDCNGNIVGNPEGYRTHRGASQQAESKHSRTHRQIWGEFHKAQENLDAQGHPKQDRLVYSIKLHTL